MNIAAVLHSLVGLLFIIQVVDSINNEKTVSKRKAICYEGGFPGHFNADIPSFLSGKTVTIAVIVTTDLHTHTRWLVRTAESNFYTLVREGVTLDDEGEKLKTNLTLTIPQKYEMRSTYKLEITLNGYCNDYVHELVFPTTEVGPRASTYARFPVVYIGPPRVQFIKDGRLHLQSLVVVSPWGSADYLDAEYVWRRRIEGKYIDYPTKKNQTENGRFINLPDGTKTYKRFNTASFENPPEMSDLGTYCLVPRKESTYYSKSHHIHSRFCTSLVRRANYARITNITIATASGSRLHFAKSGKNLAMLKGKNDMVIFEITANPQAYVRLRRLMPSGKEISVKLDHVIHQDGYYTMANFLGFVDGGKYRVEAGYRKVTAQVEFTVSLYTPVQIIEKPDDSIILTPEIAQFNFSCTVKNANEPNIQFYKIYNYPNLAAKDWNKSKMISINPDKDKRISVTQELKPNNLLRFTLTIDNATDKDAGNWKWYYMCVARDKHGSVAGRVMAVQLPWDGSIDYLYSISSDD